MYLYEPSANNDSTWKDDCDAICKGPSTIINVSQDCMLAGAIVSCVWKD